MIETVNTFSFIEEDLHKNSDPVLFLCRSSNGFTPYFVKDVPKVNVFDCLIYEAVCNRLAEYFCLKVPELAFVNIEVESYNLTILRDSDFLEPGMITLGYKDIANVDMLSKLDKVDKKGDFNKFQCPIDIIIISLFDLHIANTERNEENFNLWIKKSNLSEFYVINHYNCFGGISNIGKFTPALTLDLSNTIILSEFGLQMLKFIDLKDILITIDDYFNICIPENLESIIDEVFNVIPGSWKYSPGLNDRIKDFVVNQERQTLIKEKFTQLIYSLKR